MKKKLLLLSLVLFSFVYNAKSQVVFTYTDYAAKDDTFRISKADSLWTTNFDTTGVGITWDYSSLTPYTQTVEKVVAPTSTGYIFTPVSFQNSLDRAEPISDTLYIGSIELSNTYDFFDLTSTQYKQVARASEIEGFEIKTKYDSSDVLYTFPMQYGNAKDSSNSGYTISVSSILYYNHSQKRVNEIEGEGTLIMPYGTFSALKLKSTVYSTDSFSIDSFGIPQYSYQTVEYKWFNPNFGYPLLYVKKEIVSGITISVTARYLDSIRYFIPSSLFAYYPETPVQGDAITFQNLSTNASSYNWDFGDGNFSTSVNPTHTYSDTGTYIVTLIASNPNAVDTFSLPVFVTDSNAIISYFTYSPQYPCYGDTITFYNTSYNATSYTWDFGDGNTSTVQDTVYAYANPGTYTVKLIATKSGASDTMMVQIKYAEIPTASFITVDSVVTSPVIFTNTSTGTDASTTYYWDFGFGASPATSTEENPIVSYSFKGDKTVYLIAYNSAGCSSTYVTSIDVTNIDTSSVVSYFSFTPYNPCLGDSVLFKNGSYNASSYLWNFGDAESSTSENPTHLYAAPGVYNVQLIAYKTGSSDTSIAQIEVAALPVVAFDAFDLNNGLIDTAYIGDSVLFVMSALNVDSTSTYYWEFGVGASPFSSTATSQKVAYSSSGEKTISFTAYNSIGCYATYTSTFTILDSLLTSMYAASHFTDNLVIYGGSNNELYINFSLSEKSNVQCSIFNLLGECVYDQALPYQLVGNHQLQIPFERKGIHLVTLTTSTKKMSKKFAKL